MKKTKIIFSLIIIFSSTFSIARANTNRLANPGFESGMSGWSNTGDTATWTTSSDSHSGLNSVRGVETEPGNLGRLYQDFTNRLIPGEQYKIGGWIKTENVQGEVVIALDYVNADGWCPADGYVREIGYVTGTTDWTYYESDWFTLPPMPADCSMLWFLFDFNAGEGTAYWDDVFLYGNLGIIGHAPFPIGSYECPPNLFYPKDGDINEDGISDWYYEGDVDAFNNIVDLYGVDDPVNGSYFALVFNGKYLVGRCPYGNGKNFGSLSFFKDENGDPYQFIKTFWQSIDEGSDDIDIPLWNGFNAVPGKDRITFEYSVQQNLLTVTHYYENGDIVKSVTGDPGWGSWLWNGEPVVDVSIPSDSVMTAHAHVINYMKRVRFFSPNGDGFKDTSYCEATFSDVCDWELKIKQVGTTTWLRTFIGTDNSIHQVWDGRDESGVVVPDGEYWYKLTIEGGDRRWGRVVVDTEAPTVTDVDVSPDPFGPLPDTTTISYTLSEKSYVWLKIYETGPWGFCNKLLHKVRQEGVQAEVWDGTDWDGFECDPGRYAIRINVKDIAGNWAIDDPAKTSVYLH